jgi:hypothetical protein
MFAPPAAARTINGAAPLAAAHLAPVGPMKIRNVN